jgi:hypothetical protein
VRAFCALPVPQRWQPWVVLLLLALMFAQSLGAATQLSATTDEGFHITSGYEYLRTGRMRLFDEHTPLVKALFAWPLFFVPDLPPPEEAPGWSEGDLIQVAQKTLLAYQPIDRVIVAPRVVVALLMLVLAATVYRWAAQWFHPTGGVLAVALFAFDPNILAHGSLAATDMGATAFIFWAVWAFARYLQRPVKGRWWAAVLLLGLAQAAKLTALLLLPVLGAIALVDAWVKADKNRIGALLRRLLSYGGMVVAAALVVWALYLFEVRTLPDVAHGALPLPAASHIERLLRLQDNIAYGRESFLLGQNGMHGWWQYFPVAFALKTPLPTLLVTGLIISTLAFGWRRKLVDELALGLFPIIYAAASLTSTLNIGYRHLLPILPFLFVSAGRIIGPHSLSVGGRRPIVFRQALCAILIFCLGVEMLLIHPHYLAYFNPVAGGPDQGYRFLADSNTDWGQTLKALAGFQRHNDLEVVKLSQFTFLDPAVYGVVYEPIPPMRDAPAVLPRRFNPEPGLYAISATALDGVPLPLPSMYDWFRHREPLVRIAHAMFIYDVRADDEAPGWIAQCTIPAVPLTQHAVEEGFGTGILRRIYFDCEQSWVFPDGGTSSGWYARATPDIDSLSWPRGGERLERWPSWARHLALSALHLSFEQPTPGELPPFTIWEWTGASIVPPEAVDGGKVVFGGTLELLGYEAPRAAKRAESLDVKTYWRVIAQPSRPLSLMLHLTDQEGVPIAVGDGLGLPIEQWELGDIIVERHVLSIPDATPLGTYQVRSGAYWLDDLTRLTAGGNDAVLLTSVELTH